jgi:hypothetical protein
METHLISAAQWMFGMNLGHRLKDPSLGPVAEAVNLLKMMKPLSCIKVEIAGWRSG